MLALGACDKMPLRQSKPKTPAAPAQTSGPKPAPPPIVVDSKGSGAAAPAPAAKKVLAPSKADYDAARRLMTLRDVSFLLRGVQSQQEVVAEIRQRRLIQAGLERADLALSEAGVNPGEALLRALHDPENAATPSQEAAYTELMQHKPKR